MSDSKKTLTIVAAVAGVAVAGGLAAYFLTRPTEKAASPAPAAGLPKVEKKKKKPVEPESTAPQTTAVEKPSATSAKAPAAPAAAPAASPKAASSPAPAPAPAAAKAPAAPAPAPAAAKAAPAPAPAAPKAAPAPVAASPAPAAPSMTGTRDQTYVIMYRGQTAGDGNPKDPLTEEGKRTIRENQANLAQHNITRIIASPSLACIQSAEEAAKVLGLPNGSIRVDMRLHNVTGTGPKPSFPTPAEIRAAVPGALVELPEAWPSEPKHPEKEDNANERIWEAFITLDKQYTQENVLIVTDEFAFYRIARHIRAKPTEAIFGALPGDMVVGKREVRGEAQVQPWEFVWMSEGSIQVYSE